LVSGAAAKGISSSSYTEEDLMDDDRIEGKLKQGEGQVQETWGDAKEKVGADGDADQAEGKAKQGEGELKEAWGEAKEKAGDVWEKAKDAIDRDDEEPNR
jgi:uncharacterized protein YjbJ (UPF0337 family)